MGWTSIYQLFWGSLGTRVPRGFRSADSAEWCLLTRKSGDARRFGRTGGLAELESQRVETFEPPKWWYHGDVIGYNGDVWQETMYLFCLDRTMCTLGIFCEDVCVCSPVLGFWSVRKWSPQHPVGPLGRQNLMNFIYYKLPNRKILFLYI